MIISEECRKEVGYSLLCSEMAGTWDVQWFLVRTKDSRVKTVEG